MDTQPPEIEKISAGKLVQKTDLAKRESELTKREADLATRDKKQARGQRFILAPAPFPWTRRFSSHIPNPISLPVFVALQDEHEPFTTVSLPQPSKKSQVLSEGLTGLSVVHRVSASHPFSLAISGNVFAVAQRNLCEKNDVFDVHMPTGLLIAHVYSTAPTVCFTGNTTSAVRVQGQVWSLDERGQVMPDDCAFPIGRNYVRYKNGFLGLMCTAKDGGTRGF